MGKFCEREQNYFWLSLYVTKDSFYPSKKVGLRPTFLEGLPDSSLTKWENFVNGNKIIFGWLSIALWSNYSIYSDLLDWTWKWENFVNGNKIIFGWVYEVGTKKNQEKTQFASPTASLASLATQPRMAFGRPGRGLRWDELSYLIKLKRNLILHSVKYVWIHWDTIAYDLQIMSYFCQPIRKSEWHLEK